MTAANPVEGSPTPTVTRDDLAAATVSAQAILEQRAKEAQDNAAREAADRAERTRRRIERILALAQANHEENAGPRPTHPDGSPVTDEEMHAGWTDPAVPKQAAWARVWSADIARANKTDLAAWTMRQIEDHEARMTVSLFAENAGQSVKTTLITHGATGAGKSSALIAVGHALLRRGFGCRFVSHASYVDHLTWDGPMPPENLSREGFEQRMVDADVLVLDDFGAGWSTSREVPPHVTRITHNLLDARAGKINLVSTNLVVDDLNRMFGTRVTSRLGMDAVLALFPGRDLREPAVW